jgi:competence protein ComEC
LSFALITGIKDGIPSSVKNNFRITGTYHMLAVSGMHAVIIHMIFYSVLSFFGISRKTSLFIIFLAIFPVYLMITDFQISILRTYIMAITGFACYLFGRKSMLPGFFFTLIVILAFSPGEIYSVGFQLSFSAVLGILLSIEIINIYKIKNKIMLFILVSIGAQAFTAPFLIYYFGYLNYFTMAYNLFTSFLVNLSLVYSLSLILLPVEFISAAIGKTLTVLNNIIFKILDLTVFEMDIYKIKMQDNLWFAASIFAAVILVFAGIIMYGQRSERKRNNIPAPDGVKSNSEPASG